MRYYRQIEHTSDLGIRVWGADLKELFINSACAMYDLIVDIKAVDPVVQIEIETKADDRDQLLRNWLSELLYYFNTKELIFKDFKITHLDDYNIKSIANGEKIDKARHNIMHEIKAITFHDLDIKREDNRFITDIIFDI